MPMRAAAKRPSPPCDAMDAILVVNAGSSSLKFQVFAVKGSGGELDCLAKGQIDGVGTRPRLKAEGADKKTLIDQSYGADKIPDLSAAIQVAGDWLRTTQKVNLLAVGHRVVHGGPEFDRPVRITPEVTAQLARYVSLAPLHQPNNLAPIRALLERRPELPQVACFDTAFHRTHSALADYYALPQRFYEEGVRRYGFHGLSYEYIAQRLPQVAPNTANGRVVVAHLGSGASMCAIANGRSVESTLGFTALDGLPMGTRPGQLDPGVVLYLVAEKRMSPAAVQDLFYKESGLKGLSGISNDVRELQDSKDLKAAFALDYFAYRAGLYVGMLTAALGGLDAFVFTAGIGENSPTMRARIAERLDWLGIGLDATANNKGSTLISKKDSRIPVYVIPTNEELMIARHTLELLSAQRAPNLGTVAG
jgi:acetate kinase